MNAEQSARGAPSPRQAAPTAEPEATRTFLILGAAGDLTRRLLLPGLGALLAARAGHGLHLLGSSRADWSDTHWRRLVAGAFAAANASGPEVDRVVAGTQYRQADATDSNDLRRLLSVTRGELIIYFALPPAVTEKACRLLAEVGVPLGTRLVIEKPFGTDLASAEALNELLMRVVPEDQVHRIDHFLGMSTVLNIIGVRLGNRMIEPVLTAEHVESVDIVFDESLALEGRAGYYDQAGALVDVIQSHLLQVLALVAMVAPSTLRADDVRDAKAQVLRATRVWNDDPVAFSYRARYTRGEIDGRAVPAYVDEPGIDSGRKTETLSEVVLAVDTWRWASVPFRVRSGKALGTPRQEVAFTFKQPPRVPTGLAGYERSDRLHIGLGRRTVSIDLNINGQGDPFTLDPVTLEAEYEPGQLLEYGEVLRGVLGGEPPLSVRGDAAVQSWRIVEPVLAAWRADDVPLEEYPAGSAGPPGWPLSTGRPST